MMKFPIPYRRQVLRLWDNQRDADWSHAIAVDHETAEVTCVDPVSAGRASAICSRSKSFDLIFFRAEKKHDLGDRVGTHGRMRRG